MDIDFLSSMLRVINISNDCLKSFIAGPINHEFDQARAVMTDIV